MLELMQCFSYIIFKEKTTLLNRVLNYVELCDVPKLLNNKMIAYEYILTFYYTYGFYFVQKISLYNSLTNCKNIFYFFPNLWIIIKKLV